MQKLRGHQLIAYSVLLFLGIAFLYSIYRIATQPDLPLGDHLAQTYPVKGAVSARMAGSDNVLLRLNKAESVAGLQIVYLGVANDRLNLGVRIPELDPVYTYAHSIPLNQAKKGFRLAGRAFILLSASGSYLRLKLNDAPTG